MIHYCPHGYTIESISGIAPACRECQIEKLEFTVQQISEMNASWIVENKKLRDALSNLFSHVTMIGLAEGFPIEVQYDPDDHDTPQGFNIKECLILSAAALGQDDAELRQFFPEMFAEHEGEI